MSWSQALLPSKHSLLPGHSQQMSFLPLGPVGLGFLTTQNTTVWDTSRGSGPGLSTLSASCDTSVSIS